MAAAARARPRTRVRFDAASYGVVRAASCQLNQVY